MAAGYNLWPPSHAPPARSRLFLLAWPLSSGLLLLVCSLSPVCSRLFILACSLLLARSLSSVPSRLFALVSPVFTTSLHRSVCPRFRSTCLFLRLCPIPLFVLASYVHSCLFVPACSFSLHLVAPACSFLRHYALNRLASPVRSCLFAHARSLSTDCLFLPFRALLFAPSCSLLRVALLSSFVSIYSIPPICSSLFFASLLLNCLPSPVLFLLVASAVPLVRSRLFRAFRTFPHLHSHLFVRSCSLSRLSSRVRTLLPSSASLLLPVPSRLFTPSCSFLFTFSPIHFRLFSPSFSSPPVYSSLLFSSCSFPPLYSHLFAPSCSLPPLHSLTYSLPPVRSLLFMPACSLSPVRSRLLIGLHILLSRHHTVSSSSGSLSRDTLPASSHGGRRLNAVLVAGVWT